MKDQRRNTTEFKWISDLPERSEGNDHYRQTEEGQKRRRKRSTGSTQSRTTRRESSRRSTGRSSGSPRSRRKATRTYNNGRPLRKQNNRRQIPLAVKLIALLVLIAIIVVAIVIMKHFSDGDKAMKNGMEAFNNGYYEQAIYDFKEAISYDKDNAQYISNLGMAQIQNKDFDGALETFRGLADRASKKEAKELAYRGMGMAYLYKNSYGDAVMALSQAASFAEKQYTDLEIDILYYLAEAQSKSGDPVGAVLSYSTILDQRDDATAYLLRGVTYQEVGDSTNAEADLNKVMEMTGENFKTNMTLYQVLLSEGKEKEALKLLEKAVTMPVDNAEDYSNRGFMYMYLGDEARAMEDFDYAIDHDYFAAYFGKASLLMNQKKFEEAKENFDIYFVEFSDNAKAYNQYGICLMELGLYDEAVTAFEQGIAANDRSLTQELSFNIIVAYERTGQWKKAESAINTYIEKYPEDAVAARELRFIKSRQHVTAADLNNHPELLESGAATAAAAQKESETETE